MCFSEKGGSKLEYIRWVLTVPAIWSDPSKQFMREAAKQVSGDRIGENQLKKNMAEFFGFFFLR